MDLALLGLSPPPSHFPLLAAAEFWTLNTSSPTVPVPLGITDDFVCTAEEHPSQFRGDVGWRESGVGLLVMGQSVMEINLKMIKLPFPPPLLVFADKPASLDDDGD